MFLVKDRRKSGSGRTKRVVDPPMTDAIGGIQMKRMLLVLCLTVTFLFVGISVSAGQMLNVVWQVNSLADDGVIFLAYWLEKRGLDDASKRVVTLEELLGAPPDWAVVKECLAKAFSEDLGIAFKPDRLSAAESKRADELFATEIGTDDFVYEIDDPAVIRHRSRACNHRHKGSR